MKNVAFSVVGNLAIAYYGAESPSDEEIEESLGVFARVDSAQLRSIIVSDGGAPSPLQRKMLLDALGGKEHQSAVVTDAVKVRGAVTALSWFNKKIKAFPKSKLDDALSYLSVPDEQVIAVKKELKHLQTKLGR